MDWYPLLGPSLMIAILIGASVTLHWLIGDAATYVIGGIPLAGILVWIVQKLRTPTED